MAAQAFAAASPRRRWFVAAMIAAVVAVPFVGAALSAWL
jgi:hypothetical protein